ncbi:hypothetical protein SK128_021946, partial [Halocaridina rubra]
EVEDHVEGRGDLRALTEAREGKGWELARPEKRVVHESARKWGTVNTEDVRETSRIQDGHVVTETERTTQHEEYDNESLPDSGSSLSDGSVHEEARETQHNIVHTKDEDLVEYYAVPRGGTLAQGVKLGEGMHVVSEDFHEDREGEELDSLSERLRRARRLGALKPKSRETPERTDALTRRPLDYHEEEETRKSETNRWLENHFGSESGHSGSSHHEEESPIHTAGGNIITITMSPRPATPEDQPDAAPSGMRRWSNSPLTPQNSDEMKAPPPPPPPKPAASWTPAAHSSSHQPVPPSDEITDSMIAAARARLRSTGRILDDSEQSTPPVSPPATNGNRFTSLPDRIQGLSKSGGNYSSPPMSPSGINNYTHDDPVYSSKFRSGSPCGYKPSRLFSTPLKNSRPTSHSPPESPPPPLPSTPPPPQNSQVGRSQSFNVQTKSWVSNISRTPSARPLESRMKEFRSEEQLDTVGHRSKRLWPPPPREPSPEPYRETTPPPPPRHRSGYSFSTNNTHYNTAPTRSSKLKKSEISTQTIARDSSTQTGPSPVPPPRTKRKNKPKTYYFGEESSSASSNRASRSPLVSTSTTTQSYSRITKDDKTSPKIERRFRTTKTITPVVVATPSNMNNSSVQSSSMKNKSWHYRSMDEINADTTPRASWTNTVDPRRQPRNYNQSKEPEIKTLPKKLVNGSASPSKTYIFGNESSSDRSRRGSGSSSHIRRSHGGSMVNVSLAGMSNPKSSSYNEPEEPRVPTRGIKTVSRSQSLNVKPITLSSVGTSSNNVSALSSNLSNQQRTSSMYRSSPYLNLRSPNLIATIARSNSTRRTDDDYNDNENELQTERYRSSYSARNMSAQNNTTSNRNKNTSVTNGDTNNDDEKRNRFMKGLLTTAPELFHFIHGEEEMKEANNNNSNRSRHSPNPPESPPQLIRPPESPINSPTSPPNSSAPRIFTFGRGETGSLKRTSSLSQDNNRFSSLSRQRESITSSYLENNNNHRDSITSNTNATNQRNSLSSQYHRNAALNNSNGTNSLNRPRFNLKTSGSSLLYSPSFRKSSESSTLSPPWQRRGSDSNESPSHKWRDQDDDNLAMGGKTGGNVTSKLARDGAVLIPIKDWNSR